jgi:hypothetical protein
MARGYIYVVLDVKLWLLQVGHGHAGQLQLLQRIGSRRVNSRSVTLLGWKTSADIGTKQETLLKKRRGLHWASH